MSSVGQALRRLRDGLRASREQIDAEDEARHAQRHSTVPISQIEVRRRARVSGVLRAVTYRPAAARPVLVARLYDGSGTVDHIWLGRRSVVGIKPGTRLVAEGRVAAGRARPVIYNPTYEILGAQT